MAANKEPITHDPRSDVYGVLLSDVIKTYATTEGIKLIDPFEEKSLKPARYNLHLGDEYYVNGQYKKLSDDNPDLEIEPFSLVVISTEEVLNMPVYLIGRWNLKIPLVYKGLLWSGAAQVDPGYRGKLFCPLYNLSTERVILKYKQEIVSIDFVKTTPFKRGESLPYDQDRPGRRISELVKSYLESGPGQTTKKVQQIEKRVRGMERTFITLISIITAVLAVIIAVVGILFSKAPK